MAGAVRALLHPAVLTTSGGGGVGTAKGGAEFARAAALGRCPSIDVVAAHAYTDAAGMGTLLAGYAAALRPVPARLLVQEWGVTGANSSEQAAAFLSVAAAIATHRIPSLCGQQLASAHPFLARLHAGVALLVPRPWVAGGTPARTNPPLPLPLCAAQRRVF